MSQGAVQVRGEKMLAATLHVAAGRVADMSAPSNTAGNEIANRARTSAPRATGRLAGSHRVSADRAGATVEAATEYARYVHWGTRKMRARPWLTDAERSTESSWLGGYEDYVRQVIQGVKGA